MSTTPASPIRISLDLKTLAALFPEGSQARAELKTAVIAEFVRRELREGTYNEDLRKQVERARADVLAAIEAAGKAAIAQAGFRRDSWGKVQLSDDLKKEISEEAKRVVAKNCSEVAVEHARAEVGKMRHDVTAAANRIIRDVVDSEVRAAIKSRVAEVMAGLGSVG